MHELGARIRELREKRKFTVRDLAEALKKTPGYISRIEARGEIPSPELLCQIAGALGAKPEELLDLAKAGQLKRTVADIERKQHDALAIFRRAKK
ncbi:MAG TPA: helix-turn-helix transcriptional regulator [Pirellulales bacterium]|nr:helix-turn-helix transcriptional regulator [Pirellulales bacterium]